MITVGKGKVPTFNQLDGAVSPPAKSAGGEQVEKRPQLKVPEDYEDRANNDLWDWDADQEKVKEAEKLLRETDRCCFCDFDCPPPSEQENKSRIFGRLQSLSDHIEHAHPLAYEWLG